MKQILSKESKEIIGVGLILTFILLPTRIIFVSFVNDHWAGSLGIVTIVSLAVLYLAKKEKLGWFGKAFINQFMKIRTGKRKYVFFGTAIFFLFYWGSAIIMIDISNTQYHDVKLAVQKFSGITSLDTLPLNTLSLMDLLEMPSRLFAHPEVLIIAVGIINDISKGYMLHFAIVFVVEEIELIGISLFLNIHLNKTLNYLTKQNLSKDVKSVDTKD